MGTLTFTLNGADVNNAALLGAATNLEWVKGVGTFPTAHSHRLDGSATAVTSAATYLVSGPANGVSFTAPVPIPEPSTLALGGILLAGCVGFQLRRKQA